MTKLENLLLIIKEKNIEYKGNVTEHNLETGNSITDFVSKQFPTTRINFVIGIMQYATTGLKPEQLVSKLKKLYETSELLEYNGIKNFVIDSLTIKTDSDNLGGFYGELSLKQVQFTDFETNLVNDLGKNPLNNSGIAQDGLKKPKINLGIKKEAGTTILAGTTGIGTVSDETVLKLKKAEDAKWEAYSKDLTKHYVKKENITTEAALKLVNKEIAEQRASVQSKNLTPK